MSRPQVQVCEAVANNKIDFDSAVIIRFNEKPTGFELNADAKVVSSCCSSCNHRHIHLITRDAEEKLNVAGTPTVVLGPSDFADKQTSSFKLDRNIEAFRLTNVGIQSAKKRYAAALAKFKSNPSILINLLERKCESLSRKIDLAMENRVRRDPPRSSDDQAVETTRNANRPVLSLVGRKPGRPSEAVSEAKDVGLARVIDISTARSFGNR